jgi:hypothetical protein
MQMPPDDGVTAQIGIAAPTGIVLLRRVEALIGEFHKVAMLWRTVVRYEASELLCLPGGSSQATIADISAELDGEAHAECADRVSTVVDITSCGAPFMRSLSHAGRNQLRGVRIEGRRTTL